LVALKMCFRTRCRRCYQRQQCQSRKRDPMDERRVLVDLTPAGEKLREHFRKDPNRLPAIQRRRGEPPRQSGRLRRGRLRADSFKTGLRRVPRFAAPAAEYHAHGSGGRYRTSPSAMTGFCSGDHHAALRQNLTVRMDGVGRRTTARRCSSPCGRPSRFETTPIWRDLNHSAITRAVWTNRLRRIAGGASSLDI
jgi:hypothetical protein